VRPAGQFAVEQGYEMGRPSIIDVTVDVSAGQVTGVRVGGGVVRVAEGVLIL
jgi:trans-2,3-dihydro-3-hydroxyanthranilate isomerase